MSPRSCRAIAAFLILGAAALRLLFLANNCPFELAPDEAHYWDWSRHLDLSYYSKGPLVAWLIHASCRLFGPLSIHLTGTEMLAIRIPAVVCGSLLLVGIYVLTVRVFRRDTLALGMVVVALTMPLLAAGSGLMTIDAPYVCCWIWALVVAHVALFGDCGRDHSDEVLPGAVLRTGAKRWAWPLLGFLIGVGILAKYTMVLFVPFFGLFLLATPGFRIQLRRPGFWIIVLVAGFCCSPIVIWNAQHEWVTLRHAEGHAGANTAQFLHPFGPLRYLGFQFGILLGYWFVLWAYAIWHTRPGRERRPELLYLWWLSAPMFLFFGLFSLKNGGGEPNWPVAAYLSGMVLAAGWLRERLAESGLAVRRWLVGATAGFALFGLGLTLALHRTTSLHAVLLRIAGPASSDRPMPLRRVDPTARLRGWTTLARALDELREQLRTRGIEVELAGRSWVLPGEMGFYCQGKPAVYCFGSVTRERQSQYDLWRPNPIDDVEIFAGKTFLIVDAKDDDMADAFDRLGERREVDYCEAGELVNRWHIIVGYGFRGFPHGRNSDSY